MAEILPGLVHDKGWQKQLDLHTIFTDWREIATEEVVKHAQPFANNSSTE